jgi:hypothetical protein
MFLFLEWVDAGLIAAQFSCSLPAIDLQKSS